MAGPRVCVVGAGSSGIPVAKALRDRGLAFDVYEKSDKVGGNWVFKNKNGWSSAYRSLHINTSRDRMEYADYKMPRDYPDFPHHTQIARYFDLYVDHFGLRESIRFETGVTRITPDGAGWRVTTDRGETHRYDAVAVANGHHWDPRGPSPAPPGRFDGLQFHSHHYIDPSDPHELRGKRVIVVGMGNSAMDIACELSRDNVAARVILVARRGAHVVPHYWFGRPLDQLLTLPPWAPWAVKRTVAGFFHKLAVGEMARYGLPAPDHRIGEAHPTISSEILPRLGRGDITIKPAIRSLDGDAVTFVDGTREPADAIVWCTGYNVTFPFFEPGFLSAPDNDLPLFMRVWKPGLPSLFFIGLLQPLGAVMPLAEAQGKWIADYLCGDYALPSEAEMERAIAKDSLAMHRRYVPSARHTMQVDFDEYLYALDKERKRGAARARSRR
ncbi:MAG TPA: NAD(P)-binding domain-containing protein [Kofleriaceae bacterium]|nr:NAD(P)-binding domain-containing protein [Kofleriaceae bacterium]